MYATHVVTFYLALYPAYNISGILPDILSDLCMKRQPVILSDIYCNILSGILRDMASDILSGILCSI